MSSLRALPLYDCFAIAAPGLESLVARELAALGAPAPVAVVGGVEFRADVALLARSQLWLRTASRVLVRLATFRATAFHELERAARKVEWGRVLGSGGAFRLRVTCRKSRLYHSDAVAERVAGALQRAITGAEWAEGGAQETDVEDDEGALAPRALARSPDEAGGEGLPAGLPAPGDAVQLFVVRLDHDRCTISADASGALLHRRGYRLAGGRAPLRETLAAAMLLAVEWDPSQPLVDPLCGSGTIAIEAAMLARRMAPGLRRTFAAEHWPEQDGSVWSAARREAESEVLDEAPAPIIGADRDAGVIEAARANAARAGVAADVEFRCAALSALSVPTGPGLLIANPPYGVRVGDPQDLRDLFARLGHVARTRCAGWRLALLSGDAALDRHVGVSLKSLIGTRNGGIAVRCVVGEMA